MLRAYLRLKLLQSPKIQALNLWFEFELQVRLTMNSFLLSKVMKM